MAYVIVKSIIKKAEISRQTNRRIVYKPGHLVNGGPKHFLGIVFHNQQFQQSLILHFK